MAIEIVDFPIKNGGSFHSYVSHYQRVNLHFPMVFLWFSHGFHRLYGKSPEITTIQRRGKPQASPGRRWGVCCCCAARPGERNFPGLHVGSNGEPEMAKECWVQCEKWETHTHIYIYTYMYIYICIYIYTHRIREKTINKIFEINMMNYE